MVRLTFVEGDDNSLGRCLHSDEEKRERSIPGDGWWCSSKDMGLCVCGGAQRGSLQRDVGRDERDRDRDREYKRNSEERTERDKGEK